MKTASDLIDQHGLQPHPEGGWYVETYRSSEHVVTPSGQRAAGTAILYLLDGENVSRFHRIDADEIWHFHGGSTLRIVSLWPSGDVRVDDLDADNPQVVIKAGLWFGAALADPSGYAFVGCTVSPGFDFAGFELAEAAELLADWPNAESWIRRLT